MAEPQQPSLAADCGQCAGLCCVALHFDKGPQFAADKPAGQPCRHLAPDNRCTIHAHLAQAGYKGCARFDCHGAGQRLTALMAGTWRDDPDKLAETTRAFGLMLRLHEALVLLEAAARLPLPPAEDQRRVDLLHALALPDDPAAALAALPDKRTADVRQWLRGLAKNLPEDVAQMLAARAQAT